jgi:hypothetical protein
MQNCGWRSSRNSAVLALSSCITCSETHAVVVTSTKPRTAVCVVQSSECIGLLKSAQQFVIANHHDCCSSRKPGPTAPSDSGQLAPSWHGSQLSDRVRRRRLAPARRALFFAIKDVYTKSAGTVKKRDQKNCKRIGDKAGCCFTVRHGSSASG